MNQAAKQASPSKSAVVQPKQEVVNPMISLRVELDKMAPEFASVLPDHIPLKKFKRVILTALQTTEGLVKCKPKKIWQACMRAAVDGLMPDGREGAIVPFGDDCSWLPMVYGVRKKIFQAKEVLTLDVEVVREKDEWAHALGDKPFIHHVKYMGDGDPGAIIATYSVAGMANGVISRQIMSIWEVEQVRKTSRGTKTPWQNPIFYPEMVKKTVVRRHSKSLPQSVDVLELFEREDQAAEEDDIQAPARPKSSDFKADHDAETVDETKNSDEGSGDGDSAVKGKAEEKTADSGTVSPAGDSSAKPSGDDVKVGVDQRAAEGEKTSFEKVDPETGEVHVYGPADAMERGEKDHADGKSRKAIPPEFREHGQEALAEGWYAGWDRANELKPETQKSLV